MTGQKDFLKKLITLLDNAKIHYMLSGSFGSSFHGEPRATNDVDIVIAPTKKQLDTFIQSLGKDYYVSSKAVLDALKHNSMFNVIDTQTGWKADFIIRKKRPFSVEEFQRKQDVKIMGMNVWILSPEDLILSKLEWSKGRKSELQFRDAIGVAAVQWDNLNMEYLEKWAKELRVTKLLKQLMYKAKQLRASS